MKPADSPEAACESVTPRGKSSSTSGIVAVALLAYVFSCGPVAGLKTRGVFPVSDDTLRIVYCPVLLGVMAADKVTDNHAGKLFLSYLDFWGYEWKWF
jgi:hypothetical protein